MAVLRIHKKQQNFVILDKTCLNDKMLSWAAKGLHSYLLSLPDDWRVQVSDLQERSRNGRDAVRALLNELEQAGYIQKASCRDEVSGRFGGMEYLVLEVPESKKKDLTPSPEKASSVNQVHKNPAPGNPSPVVPAPEKPILLNNKYNNIYNNNNTNSVFEFSNYLKNKNHINPNFYPSQETITTAQELGLDKVTDPNQIQAFINHNQKQGSKWADFNPVFIRWLEREAAFTKNQQKSTGTRSNRNECHPNQNTIIQTAYDRVLQHHQAKLRAESQGQQTGVVIEVQPINTLDSNDEAVWAAFSKQTWG